MTSAGDASGEATGDVATVLDSFLYHSMQLTNNQTDVVTMFSSREGSEVRVEGVSRSAATALGGAFLVSAYATIFALGLVGNSLVILTLTRNKRVKVATNIFLLNLAVSDLLLGVFCMPFTLSGALLRNFIFGELMCKLIPYLQGVTVAVSVWTLVVISVERYLAVCSPLSQRFGSVASRHAALVTLSIWAVALAIMLPVFLLSELQPVGESGSRHKCREVWGDAALEHTFNIGLVLLLFVFPLITMSFAYANICFVLRRGMQEEKSSRHHGPNVSEIVIAGTSGCAVISDKTSQEVIDKEPRLIVKWSRVEENSEPLASTPALAVPNDHKTNTWSSLGGGGASGMEANGGVSVSPSAKEIIRFLRTNNFEQRMAVRSRVIRMMCVVVVEFFICWTPLYVINTVASFSPGHLAPLGSRGVLLFHLLAYCSSCCNPITYCFMNRNFRREFRRVIRCKGGHRWQRRRIFLREMHSNSSQRVMR